MLDFIRRIYNLQLLNAEGVGGDPAGAGEGDPAGAGEGEGTAGIGEGSGGNNGDDEKKFTQADLNRIAAAEKASGKRSLLKKLGFDSEDDIIEFINSTRSQQNSSKSEEEKLNDSLAAEKIKAQENARKAERLENKLTVLKNHGKEEYVDDITLIVESRMDDDTSFEKALTEVKKLYPSMFTDGETGTGTGSSSNPPRGKGQKSGSLGSRLGKQRRESVKSNDTYFSK